MSELDYELALPFDTDSREFARGVEAGLVWAHVSTTPPPTTVLAHTRNAEMVLRIAEAHSLQATSHEVDDNWMEVTFR